MLFTKKKQQTEAELLDGSAKYGLFRSPAENPGLINQFAVLFKRNLILQQRFSRSTLSQAILAPFVFFLLLYILQQADYSIQGKSITNPPDYPLLPVFPCQGTNDEDDKCITIGFTPNREPFTAFMTSFGVQNANRLKTLTSSSSTEAWKISDLQMSLDTEITSRQNILPFADSEFIYDLALKHPNLTKWGISFNIDDRGVGGAETPNYNIQYQIWYNSSIIGNDTDVYGLELLSLVRGLDEAILSTIQDPSATVKSNIDVLIKDWPLVPPTLVADAVVEGLGAVFFFCAEMVIFICVLNQIAGEKEQRLKIAMEMAGMKPLPYWLSHFFSNLLVVTVNALVSAIFGIVFGFKAFSKPIFSTTRVAILLGIFIFVVGLLFESTVFSSSFVGYIWWDSGTTPVAWKLLIFFPFFNFGKYFLDISVLTNGKAEPLTQSYTRGPGFSWQTQYEPLSKDYVPTYSGRIPDVPAPVQSSLFLIMNIFFYLVLAWYFDQVIPNEFGSRKSPWFFFTPSWWGYRQKREETVNNKAWLASVKGDKTKPLLIEGNQDKAVLDEKEIALSDEHWPAIKVVNLRKSFIKSRFYKSTNDKHAVKDACITFNEGSLLALLGQNGAGKSTTMNILSGLTPATSGDALMYGYSMSKQMYLINELMGVCPQHDILFNDLTAVEHIQLYAGLKGVLKKDWPMLCEDRLKCVRLWQVRHARAQTYSGGMKRRLSLVISTIGDPKIIFMDEPTTGMDPVNRRHVWSFIEKFKDGRVIVLTTHSMEEADVLGDRIAIMAHGAIRAIGNSINLKATYGAGYRINIITEYQECQAIKAQVLQRVPGVIVEDESAGALIFQFPNTSTEHIPKFVEWLEGEIGEDGKKVLPAGIITWGISQTTLEEVFLRIIREANPNGYSGYEAKKND